MQHSKFCLGCNYCDEAYRFDRQQEISVFVMGTKSQFGVIHGRDAPHLSERICKTLEVGQVIL